jgi:manganese efflux pump family protein
MDFPVIFAIAVSLSLDAFAVTIANSCAICGLQLKYGIRMSLFFAIFQVVMPAIGWVAGVTFCRYIQAFDHWIAFVLLAVTGGRMIIEGIRARQQTTTTECFVTPKTDCRRLSTLLVLSLATSLDAMAIGISFAVLGVPILEPLLVIGVVTFIICFSGFFLGKFLRNSIQLPFEIISGIVLVLIGCKILIDGLK